MELFLNGIANMMQPYCLALMIIGTIIGIVFGAIPGLSSVMAIALFLPLTYSMEPSVGIALLLSLYIGSVSGGLISAILLKIPGTPSSVATCFDGHPMLEHGEGIKALGTGVVYSFLGTIFSVIILVFLAPQIAKAALAFGPHEYFSLSIFALCLIATLSSGSMAKGVFSGVLGLAFATIGIAPVYAVTRFTFGSVELSSGFDTLSVLIGLFAVSEIIKTAETAKHPENSTVAQIDYKHIKGFGFTWQEFKAQIGNAVLAAFIGVGIGILPGIGASTSNLVAYSAVKSRSKHPEKFGTGIMDGVVASETSNNASIGGAMIPLLTLGIPGDGCTAILLGAFMVHGIAPGPLLFTSQAQLVYDIFAAMCVATILMLVIEFFGLRVFAKMLDVPKYILLPIVFVFCVVGAFALSSRMFDVWALLGFGLVGYTFTRFHVPQAPMVIGFILGSMTETNFLRALMLSDNSFSGFVTQPISAAFLFTTVVYLGWIATKSLRKSKKVQA
jgi:putative tricarboxylic transport membrane protein